MIRKARIGDVKRIYELLNHYADQKLLLPRSISSIYDHLRDFFVFDDRYDRLSGVCGLQICWEDLAEIRSLAVCENRQGRGIGAALVHCCLQEAELYGISKIFTLTYQTGFFEKQHFVAIDKHELPHKIWRDCVNCSMFPDCDEEALMYRAPW
ncbi:MAG: GNAT family N-acetyltransferase [Proteobacteria bacterium]|nr:MAG: GNAT family N-acetyltransferase [Pseudomonadota bacterium]